jgi:hypothetical protein
MDAGFVVSVLVVAAAMIAAYRSQVDDSPSDAPPTPARVVVEHRHTHVIQARPRVEVTVSPSTRATSGRALGPGRVRAIEAGHWYASPQRLHREGPHGPSHRDCGACADPIEGDAA